jgi:two-component system, chemotaxis family, chemotaxis protein CheY
VKQALIVDDSAVIRKVATRILELLGFTCRQADRALKALELCADLMPDVVLLDWDLPDSNVLDLLRALRGLPGGEAVKIVYCATENDPLAIGKALRCGADEVLFKPFDQRSVGKALEDIGLIPTL